MRTIEHEYRSLLGKALYFGLVKEDRTGVGTRSLFSQNLRWIVSQKHFPLMTGKKLFWKNVTAELAWFINGETNIESMVAAGSTIWNKWADDNGELGPVYGKQMVDFDSKGCNQLTNVIHEIKTNPNSRRHIITLWNPLKTHLMRLPPCYLYFQFVVEQGRISMQVVQRSADLFIGIPYDIALFSLFLIHVCKKTGYTPGEVSLTMVDAHVYNNQHKQIDEYLSADLHTPPSIVFNSYKDIELINYKSSKYIKTPIAV